MRRRIGLLALVVALSLQVGFTIVEFAPPAGAAVATPVHAPNPKVDIPIGDLSSNACAQQPAGKVCENEVVDFLDSARHVMGLRPYSLPSDFTSLSPNVQLLVLANLDRIVYNEAPIAGVSHALDVWSATTLDKAAARKGPQLVDNQRVLGYATVSLAGAFPNVLVAYYVWMYDDGFGGPNGGCSTAKAPGCWSHRQAILSPSGIVPTSFGAASTLSSSGQLSVEAIIAATSSGAGIRYLTSWRTLVAQGAGSHRYALSALPLLPAAPGNLTVSPGTQTVTLKWDAPSARYSVNSFLVVFHPNGSSALSYSQLLGNVTSYTAYDLVSGTTYDFSVVATNSEGSSLPTTAAATAN